MMMKRQPERGQSLVELALTLPIFLLLLVSVFDLGHVVWANDVMATAAREAARFAIVHGGSLTTDCPVGPPAENLFVPVSSADCPYPSPSKQGIKDVASHWLNSLGTDADVSVCYGNVTSCSGDVDEVGATNEVGTQLTVTIQSNVRLAAPALFGFDGFNLSATSTMLVSH